LKHQVLIEFEQDFLQIIRSKWLYVLRFAKSSQMHIVVNRTLLR
jgi:hypothetical protein